MLLRHSAVNLRRGIYRVPKNFESEGEIVGKIDEVGEREEALVVSVRKRRDMTRG